MALWSRWKEETRSTSVKVTDSTAKSAGDRSWPLSDSVHSTQRRELGFLDLVSSNFFWLDSSFEIWERIGMVRTRNAPPR